MPGKLFQRYQANNGAMNRERATSAWNYSIQSTNLKTKKENDCCDKDKLLVRMLREGDLLREIAPVRRITLNHVN